MRVQETIVDYNHIAAHHEAIHARLVNWERWVRVRPHGWFTHPMFRNFRASKQWEASPHIGTPVDTLDAALMEKAVYALPEKHREAVRSEPYRRAVATLPCAICGVHGYSQAAHANQGKGMGMKACDMTCFPLCTVHPVADGRLVQGCHERFDQGALFSKLVRRELEPVWIADTQRKIYSMGLWPKALPIQQFSTGDDFERTLKNRT